MTRRLGLAVLASGRGSNLQAILDSIDSGRLDAQVALVLSNTPRCLALDRASEAGIPTCCITRKASGGRASQLARIHDALVEADVDLVVNAGFNLILSSATVEHFRNRMLNIHPSLLPAFAGGMAPKPQRDALEHGVKVSGCTVHLVTDELDAGPILAQATVPVLDDDTPDTLASRILVEEHKTLPKVIQWFAEGRVLIQGRRTYILPEPVQQQTARVAG
ncbi:MAG: phosphoribosylglycinamide formyltransferase [Chloroflexi bacterium]|nr:phosphoribosylglycinamide formyltransferase [Chloroflexota bacterium]MCY3938477.1 phosphoribosylglycinamide formyltransferase [Chloroflexota bacterium]